MTVWAVNLTDNDLSAVAEYGDLRFIHTRYVYGDEINNEELPIEVAMALRNAAASFNPLRDYMLLIGDHLQMVAFAAALHSSHGSFRVLRWDRAARGYLTCWVRG